MLTLQDEKGNTLRAVPTRTPRLNSRSKWFSAIKYINDVAYDFHFVKGNGSHFYFLYKNTWHRMIKVSITQEDQPTNYIIVNEDWYFLHDRCE